MIHLPVGLDVLSTFDFDRQLDIVCDAFEENWKKGLSPLVTEYSQLVEPRFQKRLLRELILIERACFDFFKEPLCSNIAAKGRFDTVRNSNLETTNTGDVRPTSTEGRSSESLPSHFDRFAILRMLGRGSHGVVYEAEDVEIRRRVAIKIAYDSSHNHPSTRAFATEAANASRVEHPSIVRILDVGEYRGTHFMVSELIEGSNLSEFAASTCLDDCARAKIVAEIASGIDAAHRCGVIHRDLKPSNIMIEFNADEWAEKDAQFQTTFLPEFHRVRILDFGIAKMLDRLTSRTLDGDVVGTPHYMSPEQAAGNSANVDPRSDIFSLGVVLYELLCGKLPFDGPEVTVVSGIRDLKVPPIRSFRSDVPAGLEQIVHKCLERNPNNRYPSAAVLERDLRNWIAGKTPSVLRLRQLRQIALNSALLVSICVIVSLTLLASRNGWFTKRSSQQFAGISNLPKMDSSEASTSTNRIQRGKHFTSWLDEGLPTSLLLWMENVELDSERMLSDLDAMKFDKAGNESRDETHNWRLKFARLCLTRGQESETEEVKRLAKDFVGVLDAVQEEAWSNLLGRMPKEFVSELESQLEQNWEHRQRRALMGVLTRGSESSGDHERLIRLLKNSQTEEIGQVLPALLRYAKISEFNFNQWVREELDATDLAPAVYVGTEKSARWRGKVGLVAYGLKDWEQVDRVISFSTDPRSRNYFIYWFKQCELSIEPLLDRLVEYKDDWRSAAVLGCLSTIPIQKISERLRNRCIPILIDVYKNHASWVAHNSARIVLVAWGLDEMVQSADVGSDFQEIRTDRDWYVTSSGVQMNIVRGPIEFWFGKPKKESDPGERHRIEHSFAVSNQLISELNFAEFDAAKYPKPTASAALDVVWTDAVRYCDWINRKEGLDDHTSLESTDEIHFEFAESPFGYRLGSVWEIECYLRSGTMTNHRFGEQESEYSASLMGTEHNGISLAGPKFEDVFRSVFAEWTSSKHKFPIAIPPTGQIEISELGITKGCTLNQTRTLRSLREFVLASRNGKGVGFRLTRTIH